MKHNDYHLEGEAKKNTTMALDVQDLSSKKLPPVRRSSLDDKATDSNDQGLDLSISAKKPEVAT